MMCVSDECRYSIRHLAVGERPCKEAKNFKNCIAELIHKCMGTSTFFLAARSGLRGRLDRKSVV